MTIRKKKEPEGIVIDLTGEKGNAYYLLGTARNYANQLGLDAKKIGEEMRSGDYENLVQVFDKYFGDFVTLER